MTIDERLDAIAMHLEIIAGMQESHDKAITANERAMAANDKAIEKLTAKLDALTERTIQAMDSINTLGRIAGLRQDRLDQREQRLDRLEE